MADANATNASSSFTRAFLPGLILGLVIGGLAGAFLPDLMGGPKLDRSHPHGDGSGVQHGEREEMPGHLDERLDSLQQEAGQAADELGKAAQDGLEQAEETAGDAVEAVEDKIDEATGEQP